MYVMPRIFVGTLLGLCAVTALLSILVSAVSAHRPSMTRVNVVHMGHAR